MLNRIIRNGRMYLMVAPLIVMGLVIGLVTRNSLQNNAKELVESYQLMNLTTVSLALLLTEDDASKALLFDPDNIASDARKIRAYDQKKLVLREITARSKSAEVGEIVRKLQALDEDVLTPLDTSVLELEAAGDTKAAQIQYFKHYEPARGRYEALLRKLGNLAETDADRAAQNLDKRNQASLRNVCMALAIGAVVVVVAARQDSARRVAESASRTKSEYLAEIRKLHDQLKQENFRMSAELDVTRRLQQMMLPRDEDLREITNLDISGFMEPAAEVGGDYFDVVPNGEQVVFSMGDVTGHGLESGVIAIMVQTALRTLLASGTYQNRAVLNVLNRVVYSNAQRMKCDRNLTLSLLRYQDNFVTISGQHEEVLIVREDGTLERHDTLELGFPLGLEEDISEFIGESRVPLRSGDVMVVYTDGITEAANPSGALFGIERLSEAVRISHAQSSHAIRKAVLGSLREYIGDQCLLDDISLLVIKPV